MRNDEHFLTRLLREAGKSQAALARHLGIGPARIAEMKKGERQVQPNEWLPMAQFLRISVEDLHRLFNGIQTLNHRSLTIRVSQFVQAGTWVETHDLPESEVVDVTLPPVSLPGQTIYGLKVKGNSMSAVYPNGSIVFCIPSYELPEERGFKHGDHVVVERAHTNLPDVTEATLKEYHVAEDGSVWLMPRSNDPRFQEPIEVPKNGERFDDGGIEPLRITGLVVAHMLFREI